MGSYEFGTTTVLTDKSNIPIGYSLKQNYPNPFNPSTKITFTIPQQAIVTLDVFNTLGQKIKKLVSGTMAAGNHTVEMDGSDLTSGMYFYRITTLGYSKTMKMMLVK